MQTISYDTLVTGSGNDIYNFSFPQLDPAAGTLSSVTIKTTVSLNYGFNLTNRDISTSNFKVRVGRDEHYTTDAMSASYDNHTYITLGSYNLAPNASVSKALSTIQSRVVSTNNVTADVAGFLGTGNISFDYEPETYTDLITTASYSYNATANDTTRFSITYSFCSTSILSSGLTNFIAVLKKPSTVELVWTAVNETPGRRYEVQSSADGVNFKNVTTVPASPDAKGTGQYLYNYAISGTDPGKLYFRLKIISLNGDIDYSTIKLVTWDNPAGTNGAGPGSFVISPNPAVDHINLSFTQTSGDWQVDIISANGSLIQRNFALHTNNTRINFNHKLAAGVYFARATNQATQHNSVSSFIVR